VAPAVWDHPDLCFLSRLITWLRFGRHRDTPPGRCCSPDGRVASASVEAGKRGLVAHRTRDPQSYIAALGGHLRVTADFGDNAIELTA
jgi:hypothetical protein